MTAVNGGDTCATALDVTAGGTFSGSTAGAGINDDYGPAAMNGCAAGGSASGRDVAYAVSPSVTTSYVVRVTPLNAAFDPMLYAQLTCGANACLAATVLNGPNQAESITFTVSGGQTAYLIVDGELGTEGPFELTVTGTPTGAGGGGGAATGGGGGSTGGGGGSSGDAGQALNGGNTCAMAPDVTAGGVFVGTTDAVGIVDTYGPAAGNGCASGGSASGRDVAYALSPLATTTYTVRVTPLNATFDPMLYVQLVCGGNACLAATILNGPGQPESLTFTVQGGQTAYVIVDGELVSKGPFELSVQF